MATVIPIKGIREAPKSAQSRMETVILSRDEAAAWRLPPFQRPLRVNAKVEAVAETLKESETIEGVLTLGRIGKDGPLYVVDGQHRREAFLLSGLSEAIADIRILHFDSMSDMAEEFVRLNSSLVKMRPDDILRGLESSVQALRKIRENCEFVGYDQIRRGSHSGPVLSMSSVVRCWAGSAMETPTGTVSNHSVSSLAENMDANSVQNLITFLLTAHAAWGRDPEYYRLWGNLNLSLCMWLWRRLVLDRDRIGNKRYVVLTIKEFKDCLMAASADGDYVSWLVGRNLSDRDRSPCYGRLKQIFSRRLSEANRGKVKILLPQPAWSSK